MSNLKFKRFLIFITFCSVISIAILSSHFFNTNHTNSFLFGAIDNFFKWWNSLDPTVRFLLILTAALSIGVLTGFVATGTGGLLFGVFTGFGSFCSFSNILTSAFTKTVWGQNLKKKYGDKYNTYIMWINWALNVFALAAAFTSVLNTEKLIDAVLQISVIGLITPDLISQSNILNQARKGNYSKLNKYLEDHRNDDKKGVFILIASLLLILPPSFFKYLQKSDQAHIESLVEDSNKSNPEVYERIKSFFEVITEAKDKAEPIDIETTDNSALYTNLFNSFKKINSNHEYNNDFFQAESNFIIQITFGPFGQLGNVKKVGGDWNDINSLWQEKYTLFQHVKENFDNNSSYKDFNVFYDNSYVFYDSNMRISFAFLELLNGIPKESFNIEGFKVLYNDHSRNLLVLKNGNIMDIFNIDPQFVTFLRFQENKNTINLSDLKNDVQILKGNNNVIENIDLQNILFKLELLESTGTEVKTITNDFIDYIKKYNKQNIVGQVLSNTNTAFDGYLDSFNYKDNKSKDFCCRELTSESNKIGLKRLEYYYFLEKTFSEMYTNLYNLKDAQSDNLIKASNKNIKRYKEIKNFENSIDCRTLIAIPFHFR